MRPSSNCPNRAALGMPKIVVMLAGSQAVWASSSGGRYPIQSDRVSGTWEGSALHERAAAFVQRPECLLGRDSGERLVKVPLALRLGGLLHLEEVHRVDRPAIRTDRTLAEQRIVDRRRLHLGHQSGGVLALRGFDGLQVVQHARIYPGLSARRHLAAELRRKAFRELACLVVLIPVERFREDKALGRLQPKRLHVARENKEPGECLTALGDAELGGLLDR